MSKGESYEEFVEKFKPKKTTDDIWRWFHCTRVECQTGAGRVQVQVGIIA